MKFNLIKNKSKYFVLLGVTLLFYSQSYSQSSGKEEIKSGIYIEDIHNIDYSRSTFEIIFYLWVNSNTEIYNIEKAIDINGSIEVDFSGAYDTILKSGTFRYHSERRVKAKVLNNFDVDNFPFDKVLLKLNIEFLKNDAKLLSLILDTTESEITPEYIGSDSLKIITNFRSGINKYNSNYGNSDLGEASKYPKMQISLTLEREQWNVFLKLFITLIIAIFLSASSILLPLAMSEEKFGLIVGSLFTAIGNKYITDETPNEHAE